MRQPLVPQQCFNRDRRRLVQVIPALAQRVPLYLAGMIEQDTNSARRSIHFQARCSPRRHSAMKVSASSFVSKVVTVETLSASGP